MEKTNAKSRRWADGARHWKDDARRLFKQALATLLVMGASMNAYAGLFGLSGTSWKEEVLLHDGSRIVVERRVERGGRHEIGQIPPIKEQSLSFSLPTTDAPITWASQHSQDIGLADFKPILLDIMQGTAYVVSVPVGCLSYNKWGRPNPPYVIFKYQDKEWQRITLQELPVEIRVPNLIISSPDSEVEKIGKSFVTHEMVLRANSDLKQPEYRSILREPLPQKQVDRECAHRVFYKGGWISPGEDSIGRRVMDTIGK